ncbi:MAG: C-terminal helicase domain-containing protein [Candidatus Berkelbacteria bacterium]|nr:C-terminal helicase domain-containing protein [Candidatus Berkelbacteria bacterium]
MKFTQLQELLNGSDFRKVLIFAETKIEVERLAKSLSGEGFKAESIHGDKRQRERQRALKLFKENAVNILVATDVAARGIDVKDISHVINYTIPQTYNDYIHRIGRTGRGDSKGIALTFV